jgi:hypothetical protein
LLKVLLLDVQALQVLFQAILKLVCLPLLHGMWSAHAAELLKNETALFFHKQDKVSLVSSNNLLLFVCVLDGPGLALPAQCRQCFAPGFWVALLCGPGVRRMHWLDPTQTKQHQAKKQPVAVVRAAIQASFITERFKLLD